MRQEKAQGKLASIHMVSLLIIMLSSLLSCGNQQTPANQPTIQGKQEAGWSKVQLPDISQQPIRLRVANVVNPRFRQLSQGQLEQIMKRCQQLVKHIFISYQLGVTQSKMY